jgi:simple sugar transport system permease protein
MDALEGLLGAMMRSATPLAFAALGGLFSERSGVINIGLEGLMLISAFAAAVGSYYTGSPLLGLGAAILAGLAFALVHAAATITFEADQIISGTAINLLALGGTGFLMVELFGSGGTSPRVETFNPVRIPLLAGIPVIGEPLFDQSLLVYLLYLLVPVCFFALYRTRFGLRLRATGEVPEAVDVAGISVTAMRYRGVALSGVLAACGGAYLSISNLSSFTENMTLGSGFIALAALIFGRWDPVRAVLAALLFGFAQGIVQRGVDLPVPNELIDSFPYLVVIVALAAFGGRAIAPAALGKPYRKE